MWTSKLKGLVRIEVVENPKVLFHVVKLLSVCKFTLKISYKWKKIWEIASAMKIFMIKNKCVILGGRGGALSILGGIGIFGGNGCLFWPSQIFLVALMGILLAKFKFLRSPFSKILLDFGKIFSKTKFFWSPFLQNLRKFCKISAPKGSILSPFWTAQSIPKGIDFYSRAEHPYQLWVECTPGVTLISGCSWSHSMRDAAGTSLGPHGSPAV